MSFFNSIEFYTIMAVIAAAIVAFAARPRQRGPVQEHLAGSRLRTAAESTRDGLYDEVPPDVPADSAALVWRCLDNGHVLLQRTGLEDVSTSGAVSIAMLSDGFDIEINERITPGNQYDMMAATAEFDLDCLRPGRYHIRYNSEKTGMFGAFSLHVRPGIVATRLISR